ncbi:MAG: type II toxin-antitoxin system RelB/DinJ family antitoxin [Candidatus Eremiobacterota bacterium]
MPKDAMIRARTQAELKTEVEGIFKELGLSVTEAINLFFTQVKLHRGLPFEVKIPNEITRKTFEDTDSGKNIIKCENEEDMFRKLGS